MRELLRLPGGILRVNVSAVPSTADKLPRAVPANVIRVVPANKNTTILGFTNAILGFACALRLLCLLYTQLCVGSQWRSGLR